MSPPPPMVTRRPATGALLAEVVLVGMVIAGFVNVIHRFMVDRRLPQPFVFDFNDTFMDWFNTAYYAHNPGAYDVWSTVYPPLSFVFLKFAGVAACYTRDPFYARHCDVAGIAAIFVFYALAVVVAFLAFRRADRSTALIRGIGFGLSMPMLFVLERGNLIIPCLTCYVFAHADLTQNKWVRAAATAMTINFKPYLVLPTFAWAVTREWRRLELAAIATIVVFCLTFAALGDGSPAQLLRDTVAWTKFTGTFVWEQIYYSTSFAPFLEFDTARFPTRDFIPSTRFEPFVAAIPVVIRGSQAMALICLAGAWLQPRALTAARLSLLLIAVSLVSSSPGGYTLTFVTFLLFLEKWARPGPIVALVAGYLLCVPFDYELGNFVTLSGDSWLANQPVTASFGITVGMFARPALMLILFWGIAADSLWLIVRAHRRSRPVLALMPALPAGLEPA